jgi:CheY-like chemotaxis protein
MGIPVVNKRILLADDEGSVREVYALLLGLDGHQVVQTRDGVEALEVFSRERFDLVITDYEMPRMRGDELGRRILAARPDQPIIMITAFELPARMNPVKLVVNKPFTVDQLRQAIAAALGHEAENKQSE